jgi:hypothetical protein
VAAGLVIVLSLGKKGRRDMSAEGVLGDLADEPGNSDGADDPGVTSPEPVRASVDAA